MTATASDNRLQRRWGHNPASIPTRALSLVSNARKLAPQELVTMVSSNRSHSGSANPNSSQQSERHRRGGQAHQRGAAPAGQAVAQSQPTPSLPLWTRPRRPRSSFPLGSGCIATQLPPIILCYFRLPGTAHCQLPRVGLQLSGPKSPS